MRSDLIFEAMLHVSNRYLLDMLVVRAVRGLHRPGVRIEDTTNDVLVRFIYANPIAEVRAAPEAVVVSIHRKSARRVDPHSSKVVTLTPVRGIPMPYGKRLVLCALERRSLQKSFVNALTGRRSS